MTLRPAPEQRPSPWRVAATALVIASLVAGLAGVALHLERERYRERAVRATANVSQLLAQHVEDALDQVDGLLLATRLLVEAGGGAARADPARLNRMLADLQAIQPGLLSLRMLDARGIVRFGVGVPTDSPVDLSDRDYFRQALEATEDRLIVAGPVMARINKQWVLVLARRLKGPDGAFAGVLYANVPATYFEEAFASVALGKYGAATIRTTDLALVHRVPAVPGKIGTREVSKELREVIAANPGGGDYLAATAIDGIERTNAFRRVGSYPLYVIVGLATDDYLGGWYANRQLVTGLAGLAILVTVLAAILLHRSRTRLVAEIDEHARASGALALAVAERDRLNRELAEKATLAQAADRAKSAFLANMSHEIRTPLNGVIGMAHLVRRGGLNPEQAKRMDLLELSARHLLDLINSILDLSRIESGRLELERGPVAPRDLLEEARDFLLARLEGRPIEARIEVKPLPGELTGDATRLRQALLNYADNAAKFTERGRITLGVRALSFDDRDALLRFEVRDTGPGIDEATRKRLFARFEQADNSTTRRFGGTGLGLAITQRLAQLMGGDAGVESVAGEGSTFWFTARLALAAAPPTGLPPDVAETVALAREERAIRAAHAGTRILLAEDDDTNRELVCSLLENTGLSIDCARDGAEAVAMAAHGAYRLVLMDLDMPRRNGYEATREILASTGPQAPVVIAVTASAFEPERARCLEAGMRGVIIKPLEPVAFLKEVAQWLAVAAGK